MGLIVTDGEMMMICSSGVQVSPATPIKRVPGVPDGVEPRMASLTWLTMATFIQWQSLVRIRTPLFLVEGYWNIPLDFCDQDFVSGNAAILANRVPEFLAPAIDGKY